MYYIVERNEEKYTHSNYKNAKTSLGLFACTSIVNAGSQRLKNRNVQTRTQIYENGILKVTNSPNSHIFYKPTTHKIKWENGIQFKQLCPAASKLTVLLATAPDEEA